MKDYAFPAMLDCDCNIIEFSEKGVGLGMNGGFCYAADEELFERAYKHLNMKFGEKGYAKFFFKDEEYEIFLKEIRELLSDKEVFINTQRNYINELKDKGVI